MKKALLTSLVLLIIFTAQATTITVTNINNNGAGSLRQAVIDAIDGDTIRFNSNLILSGNDTIKLNSEIASNKGLIFKGLYNASDTLFISGENNSRIFNFDVDSAVIKSLLIDSLTIINGNAGIGNGGGIQFIGDSLFISNSFIRNNAATRGGGISLSNMDTCVISVNNSAVSSNTGDGIFSLNIMITAKISNSTIANNTNVGVYIFAWGDTSKVTVNNSTINNNGSIGLLSWGNYGSKVNIENSSIINNDSVGVYSYGNSNAFAFRSLVNIYNSTITNNVYGGIMSLTDFGLGFINIGSCIVVSNGFYNVRATSFSNALVSSGYNIFSNSSLTGSVATDQLNATIAQINLKPLGFYGGTTPTAQPDCGSIAIDMGSPIDMSNAQNIPIIGRRDVGASESNVVNTSVTIVNDTITSGAVGASYQWIDCNNGNSIIVGATNPFFISPTTGCMSYAVIVTENGCTDTSACTTINSSVGIDTQTACYDYTWIDGNTYTISNNIAMDTLVNALGCDSIVILNLTIYNSSAGIDTQTACNSYTWINGNTYTSNNSTAKDTLVSVFGCDSIVTLNLTINTSSAGIDTQTACDIYTWIDGNTYTISNNTATDTLINFFGCDSIVTLNLTINNSNAGTDVQIICNSYLWIDGNTYTSNTTTPTFTLTNVAGCDSTVTLNLTINTVDTSITDVSPILTANATSINYQWLDCNTNFAIISNETNQSFTATTNGSYAVQVTANGCTDTSACYTITGVGIDKNNLFSGVSIYPNPNNGVVNIDLGNLQDFSIKVFNVSGQLLYAKTNINTTIHQFEFNEAPGIYFIELKTEDNTKYFKLIKK